MVRRTKEEAEHTRQALLDAAECVFQRQGVSATTLADIASAAGATRGAVYWHFRDKADLLNAMFERVRLPLEHVFRELADAPPQEDPLPRLRRAIDRVLYLVVHDPRTRRVLEVSTHKVEYTSTLCGVRERHLAVRGEFEGLIREALVRGARARSVRLGSAAGAAIGLHALLDGMIQNWLLQPDAFDLRRVALRAVDVYLMGLGLGPQPARPAPRRGA